MTVVELAHFLEERRVRMKAHRAPLRWVVEMEHFETIDPLPVFGIHDTLEGAVQRALAQFDAMGGKRP